MKQDIIHVHMLIIQLHMCRQLSMRMAKIINVHYM